MQNDWVISRVFQKTSGGKKVHISGLMRMGSAAAALPPLMDPSPYNNAESGHVHCFSNNTDAPMKIQENFIDANHIIPSSSIPMDSFPSAFPWGPAGAGSGFQLPASVPLQDPAILRQFLANYNMSYGFKNKKEIVSMSQETVLSTENSSIVSNLETGKRAFEDQENTVEPQDLDCIWSY